MMEMVRLYPVHKKKQKNRRASNWHRCFILTMSQKINIWKYQLSFLLRQAFTSDSSPIQSCLLTEAELRHDFFFFFYFWWLKSGFLFLWCWRPTGAGAEMYFTSYTKQRGGGGTTERTRVSAQCGERVTWIQTHRHTHTLAACCCSVAHG